MKIYLNKIINVKYTKLYVSMGWLFFYVSMLILLMLLNGYLGDIEYCIEPNDTTFSNNSVYFNRGAYNTGDGTLRFNMGSSIYGDSYSTNEPSNSYRTSGISSLGSRTPGIPSYDMSNNSYHVTSDISRIESSSVRENQETFGDSLSMSNNASIYGESSYENHYHKYNVGDSQPVYNRVENWNVTSNHTNDNNSENLTVITDFSKRRHRVRRAYLLAEARNRVTNKEIVVPKPGIYNRIKLGFESLDSKLEKVYIKYHDIAKRKFLWTIWEKNTGNYSSYEEFKKSWNPDSSIIKIIKADIKSEIKELLYTNDPFNTRTRVKDNHKNYVKGRNSRR